MAGIVVVDYHKGNLSSVVQGLNGVGYKSYASDKPEDIRAADGVVIPGVGSFADAMMYLNASGQGDAIREHVASGKPLLGICLGLHILFDAGDELGQHIPEDVFEEDNTLWCPGLGILPGRARALVAPGVKVPHMGWNSVEFTPKGAASPLFTGVPDGSFFYFTHSYVVVPENKEDSISYTEHALPFVSAVGHDNVFATQFHPEKSSAAGQIILANFGRIVAESRG